jgi:hypothetical protein
MIPSATVRPRPVPPRVEARRHERFEDLREYVEWDAGAVVFD